jgi:hypothetical protein
MGDTRQNQSYEREAPAAHRPESLRRVSKYPLRTQAHEDISGGADVSVLLFCWT